MHTRTDRIAGAFKRRWRRHIPRVLVAAATLFSIFLTLQLIWAAFPRLAMRLEAPRIWLSTDLEHRSYLDAIQESRGPRELITEKERTTITVIARPGSYPRLSVNGQNEYLERKAGGLRHAQVNLRPGRNNVVVREAQGSSDNEAEDRLTILRRANPPMTPQVIAWRQLAGTGSQPVSYEWLLIGSPETEYDLSRHFPDGNRFGKSDSLGVMRVSGFHGPPNGVPQKESAAANAFTFVETDYELKRSLVITLGEHSIQLDASVDLNRNSQLAQYLVTSGDVLKHVFGICIAPVKSASDVLVFGNYGTMECWSSTPADEPDDRVKTPKVGHLKVYREIVIPSEGVSLNFMPESLLGGTFLLASGDKLTVVSPDLPGRNVWIVPGAEITELPQRIEMTIRRDTSQLPDDYAEAFTHGPVLTVTPPETAPQPTSKNGSAPDKTSPTRDSDAQPHFRDKLARIENRLPTRIGVFANQLVSALPFLYFLWVLSEFPLRARPIEASLRAATLVFLAIHLSVAMAGLFETNVDFNAFAFAQDLPPDSLVRRLLDLIRQPGGSLSPFAGVGIALLTWPAYGALRRQRRNVAFRANRLVRFTWSTIFAIAVLAIPAHTIWRLTSYESHLRDAPVRELAIAMGVALVSLGFVLVWLIREVMGIPIPRWAIHIASWSMVLAPGVPLLSDGLNSLLRWAVVTQLHVFPFMLPERASRYVAQLLVTALGSTLLWRVAALTVGLGQASSVYRWWRGKRAFLLLAAVIVSIPVSDYSMTELYGLVAIVQDVGRLLPYALLAGVVGLVRCHNPSDGHALTDAEVHLGALVFAWYIAPGGATVLFIPVSFLMAWSLFTKWLLVTRTVDGSKRLECLKAYIDQRRARSRLENMQRGLDKKFSEGDLKLEDYNARLTQGEAMLQGASERLAALAPNGGDEVLAIGPESGPLANARNAVLYGIVISAPFQIQTLTHMETNGWGGGIFPLLQFGFAVVYSVLTWCSIAAVFGYFYHWIRGRNGFEKALYFSISVALCSVPQRLVQGQSIMDRALIVNSVQLVAYVLVLALIAFDLRTLQKVKYGWRELMATYGMASAAYGSTLALTVVSAVSGKDVVSKVWQWLTGS